MSIVLDFLRRSLQWPSISAGVFGTIFGAGLGFSLLLSAGQRRPVIIHSAYELDGIAARGGHLDIFFDLDRQRDCPSETSRWLWTWVEHNGTQVKQYFPLTNTSTTTTDLGAGQEFILSIPLPPGIWEGSWYYWSKTVEHCSILPSLFRAPIRETPNIPVQIIKPDSERRTFGAAAPPP